MHSATATLAATAAAAAAAATAAIAAIAAATVAGVAAATAAAAAAAPCRLAAPGRDGFQPLDRRREQRDRFLGYHPSCGRDI